MFVVLSAALLSAIVHAGGNTGPIPPHLRGCANITVKSAGNCPLKGYECDEKLPIRYKVWNDEWWRAEVRCVDKDALLAVEEQIVDRVRCKNKIWISEGDCLLDTTSVVCAKCCDVGTCRSFLRNAPSKYYEMEVHSATKKSKCAKAVCKYGFAALKSNGALIKEFPATTNVTCSGNGKWTVSKTESFDHLMCKKKTKTCGDYLCDQNCNTISFKEAEDIVRVLEKKINKYFGESNQDAIADLYSDDCVIADKRSKTALFGKEGVKTTNLAISKGEPMVWKTWNKALDVAATHFVLSGDCELYVQADDKTYKGTFKQILQKFGKNWLLIYEMFDLV